MSSKVFKIILFIIFMEQEYFVVESSGKILFESF